MHRFLLFFICYLQHSEAYSINLQGKVDLGKDLGVFVKDVLQDIITNKEGTTSLDLAKLLSFNGFKFEPELRTNKAPKKNQKGETDGEKLVVKLKWNNKPNEAVETPDKENIERLKSDFETREDRNSDTRKEKKKNKVINIPNHAESDYEVGEGQKEKPRKRESDYEEVKGQNEKPQKRESDYELLEIQNEKPWKGKSDYKKENKKPREYKSDNEARHHNKNVQKELDYELGDNQNKKPMKLESDDEVEESQHKKLKKGASDNEADDDKKKLEIEEFHAKSDGIQDSKTHKRDEFVDQVSERETLEIFKGESVEKIMRQSEEKPKEESKENPNEETEDIPSKEASDSGEGPEKIGSNELRLRFNVGRRSPAAVDEAGSVTTIAWQ